MVEVAIGARGLREHYANDLGAKQSLVAVSPGPNRSKGDKDVAEWMPPDNSAVCRYASEWVATKLRWKLTADTAERDALRKHAKPCKETVRYRTAEQRGGGGTVTGLARRNPKRVPAGTAAPPRPGQPAGRQEERQRNGG
ncbi:hypothetical protein [Streptomyces iconiensis]|uniref:hypothetical protein n=1 Tax=Streptomyces iconiensis TaxID=1384038 RepID=UPI0032198EE8